MKGGAGSTLQTYGLVKRDDVVHRAKGLPLVVQ